MRLAQAYSVLKVVATHRVTYRFLAVALAAMGIAGSDQLSQALETAVCLFAGGCV
ncbi:gp19.5 family protein [Pseudomonas oryzihabitans]|uniref:gp19.5 family protein n=1 Tax=Pseudomonas oryzihabitans TaxID=47885 RepID=UPI001C614DCA